MLDVAARRAQAGPYVNGPLPSGLVRGAADGHAPDANDFESSFFEHSYLVGLFKTLQNCLKHRHNSLASRIWDNAAHHTSVRFTVAFNAEGPPLGAKARIFPALSGMAKAMP